MTAPEFDSLWNYDDPIGTEAAFRSLLDQHPNAPEPWRAELTTQIARTMGLQRRFEEADRLLDEALALANSHDRAMARWNLEKGRVRNSNGKATEAAPFFLAALDRAERAQADYEAVDALHMLAIVAPPEEQMPWHERAIERAKKSVEPRARNWRASLLNNLGWTLHTAGRFEEALSVFEEALEARKEQGKEGPTRIARWCVARCLRSLGRNQEALERQRALKAEGLAAGAEDGFVEEEIAECLIELGEPEPAAPYFAKAHELLSADPWLAANEASRLERMRELGKVG